jgi:sec-independent protein translocase protein TatA
MFGLPGGMEWVLIIVVILIFFGGRKIPELMKGLGSGIREFKQAASGQNAENSDDKKSDKV